MRLPYLSFFTNTMKGKKVTPTLHDHNVYVNSIHRNISVTGDGQQRKTTTTYALVPSTGPPTDDIRTAPIYFKPEQNKQYSYEYDHIPF